MYTVKFILAAFLALVGLCSIYALFIGITNPPPNHTATGLAVDATIFVLSFYWLWRLIKDLCKKE